MGYLKLLWASRNLVGIVLLCISLLGTFAYVRHLQNKNDKLLANNAVLESNLAASNDSILKLQGSLNEQNAAVDQMKRAADERARSHAVEIAAANAKSGTYKQQAADIMKYVSQDPDKCRVANDLINREITKNEKR
jgi:hypothetical protein